MKTGADQLNAYLIPFIYCNRVHFLLENFKPLSPGLWFTWPETRKVFLIEM